MMAPGRGRADMHGGRPLERSKNFGATLRRLLARSASEVLPPEARPRLTAAIEAAAGEEAARVRSDPPAIMTPAEVAAYLRLREEELRRLLHQIPHFVVAGQVRFRRERLERWIELQEQRTAAAASGGPILALMPDEGPTWALVG